ncbi:hypothetical protein JB92DRAFT_3052533 [Gautieria morchelliformis]|nr:hypothetical protein JB92DRAFT_3052533 [Gautieria morchelliformis]
MAVTTVLWIMFAMFGQWGLLALLATFGVVSSLPQGHNPFLINFLTTSFLATWPPCLLFFTGEQERNPPHELCLVQSILIDGSRPMFGISMAIFVFHTWRSLKCKLVGETPATMRSSGIKGLLILMPYLVFTCWCIASLVTALKSPFQPEIDQFVFCTNTSAGGTQLRRSTGFFTLITGIFQFCISLCIARLVWHHSGVTDSECCRLTLCIALRILVFCSLQLIIILLSVLDSLVSFSSIELKGATQILQSMNGLMTFLVWGTQKDVLKAWRIWRTLPTEDVEGKP